MPKVPTYDNPQAEPNNLPGARFEAPRMMDLAGQAASQLGRGLNAAGADLAKVALEQQADINEAEIKGRVAQFTDLIGARLRDPQKGYLYTTGKDAIDGYDGAFNDITDVGTKVGEGLRNDAQRKMWTELSTRLTQQAINEIRVHAGSQTREYNAQQSEALANSAIDAAVRAAPQWDMPGSPFPSYMATVRAHAVESAQLRHGQKADPALIDQAVKKTLTFAAAKVVEDLVERGQSEIAKAYLAKVNDGDLDKAALDKLRHRVDAADVETSAFKLVDKAMAGANGDYAAAMKAVLAEPNGKIAQAAEIELHRRQSFDKANTAENDAKLYGSGKKLVEDGKPWKAIVSSGAYGDLSDGRKADLKNYFDAHWREVQAASTTGAKTDPATYQKLYDTYSDDPKAFAGMDLSPYLGKLDEVDKEFFIRLRGDLRGGKKKAEEAASQTQQISSYAKTIKGAAEQAAFTKAAHDEIQSRIEAGEKIDFNARKKILDSLILQRNPGMFSPNKPGYKLTPDERKALPVVIPPTDLREIEAAFKKRGKKPTDEEIQTYYRRWKGIE